MLSFIKPWIPAAYRDLLDFISPSAFNVIDWKNAIADLARVSSGALLGSDGKDAMKEEVQRCLTENVLLSTVKGTSQIDAAVLGNKILETYFAQFRSEKGVFLDLRLKNFSMEGDLCNFEPTDLIYRFSDDFRQGMLLTYDGFYRDNEARLKFGMQKTGLLPMEASHELFEETRDLLFKHFDTADEHPIAFDLGKFRTSFHDLFMHLKKHDIQLPADFLFLGFYLVTLYQSLQELNESYLVKTCYLNAAT
jgi:predicted unusual protein kinase regulating ubiquinone biosynthesis (AarF/ABC1/UbiB family)